MSSGSREAARGEGLRDLRDRLDRRSSVPLYYQLQDILYHAIRSHTWSPGDRLPTEAELSAALGVSRAVVREALKILEDDGEILRRQGVGTFVADPRLDHVAGGLVRFAAGGSPVRAAVEILGVSAVKVDEELQDMLGADHAKRVDWLLHHGDHPLAVAYSYLPLERLTAFTERIERQRPLPSFDARDLAIEGPIESEVSVLTSVAAAYPSEQLRLKPGSPVYVVSVTETAVTHGTAGIVEFARLIYRSDRASLHIESAHSERGSGIVTRIVTLER
jgi:DNA-binding GntR family transcriptional regulator